jgi:N-acetylglucosaminyl-diphospho-decaprenol L-rhamnosyltransferase
VTDTYEGTSAIVVNFESGQLLVSCVRSLEKAGAGEVIVVDNASGDDSIERLREAGTSARIVLAPSNRGFGAGANLGARQASGEVLVVCNPDLVVEEGSLTALVEALVGHADVAAVGPRILTDEGELYPSARPFPTLTESAGHAFVGLFTQSNRWTRAYRQEDRAAGEVDWVSGACAAFRREAFAAVGGFDERYFMYVEDVDLCWRLQRAGWRVLYEPAATVTHVQGASTRRRPYRMLVAHHRSLWRFACKTAVGKQKLALPAVALGLCARLCLAVAKHAATGRVVT